MLVMGARGATKYVLGHGASGAAAWWQAAGVTPIAAYQAKGAASLADSYINLANPGTYNAAPGVAPTWAAATGWTFDGLTQYLVTGLTLSPGATIIVNVTRSAGHYRPVIVQDNYRNSNGAGIALWTADSINGANYGNRVSSQIEFPMVYPKVFCVTAGAFYINGSYIGNPGTTWTPVNTLEIARGYFVDLSGIYYGSPIIPSIAIYNTTLSAAQVAAISSAMTAL